MKNFSSILGVRVDLLPETGVLTSVHRFIDSGKPHHIVTVNTEYVMEARHNQLFKQSLDHADIALADGAGIVLAARIVGEPLPPHIPGVDFVQKLAHEAAKLGFSLYLLGGQGGVAAKTAELFRSLYPGITIVGVEEGSPDDISLIDKIRKAGPDILLVAWGAPKQDLWIHRHKERLNVPVMMGVGGTFDFLVGKQKRAPQWMRETGLEWLWRLIREPWRWRRQLALPQMFVLIFWQKLIGKSVT